MKPSLHFGWLSPVIGNRWSDHKPIVMYQETALLPTAVKYFDSVWIADHFYGFDAKTDPFLEAWTTLTWLAAKFPEVQLCHHVLGHGYRPPALTAKMAATLQVLSGNRFILGIGAGWRGDEYEAYGYPFPRTPVRFEQLEEVIQICRRMWTEDFPTFEGKHYSITEASAPPLPTKVPPICIGTSGEKVGIPMAGRLADIWHGFGRADAWTRRIDILHTAAANAGRDPSEITIATTIERPLPESDADSDAWLEVLAPLADVGVSMFVMDFGNPETPDHIGRFAEQVMAPLRARS